MKEIMLPYILVCWLLIKFKIVKNTVTTYTSMVIGGILLMMAIFFAHRLWSPVDITNSTTVKAPHSILSPAVGFEIDKIYVEHNEFVTKGQLLYRLVDTSQAAQHESAQAQKASALSNLAVANSQVETAKLNITQAQRRLQNVQNVQKFASQDENDEAQERLVNAQQQKVTALAQQATAQAQISVAIANMKNTEYSLQRLNVTAPFDGMVTHVYIDKGTRIGSLHLFNTEKRFIEMRIPDQAYANVSAGQFAEFYVDAYPGEVFRARVHSVVRATGESTGNLFPGEQSVAQHIMRGAPKLGRTVILEFEDPQGYHIPIGATGTAWISAKKPHSFFSFIDIIGGATVRLQAAKSYITSI